MGSKYNIVSSATVNRPQLASPKKENPPEQMALFCPFWVT